MKILLVPKRYKNPKTDYIVFNYRVSPNKHTPTHIQPSNTKLLIQLLWIMYSPKYIKYIEAKYHISSNNTAFEKYEKKEGQISKLVSNTRERRKIK